MGIREQIFSHDKLPVEKVACPEWGCDVYIRTLSGTERDDFDAASLSTRGKKREINLRNLRARLVVLSACDEAGTPLFVPDDVSRVGSLSSKVLDRLFTVAQRLNGITEEDVTELVKN